MNLKDAGFEEVSIRETLDNVSDKMRVNLANNIVFLHGGLMVSSPGDFLRWRKHLEYGNWEAYIEVFEKANFKRIGEFGTDFKIKWMEDDKKKEFYVRMRPFGFTEGLLELLRYDDENGFRGFAMETGDGIFSKRKGDVKIDGIGDIVKECEHHFHVSIGAVKKGSMDFVVEEIKKMQAK